MLSNTQVESSKRVRRIVRIYAIFTSFAILFATIYSIFAIVGRVPASIPIFFLISGVILIPHSLLNYFFWKNRSVFNIGTQVFFMLWSAVAFWYWTFVPLYYFSNMTLNTLQLAIAMFAYFWEVPAFGGILFAYVGFFRFKPFSNYLNNRLKPANPEKFYTQLLRYPLWVVIWAFFISTLGYVVSSGLLVLIGKISTIELVKNAFNGFAVVSFVAIAIYLLLDVFLSDIRGRLKKEYPILRGSSRTLTRKVAGINILLVVGTTILVSLIAFKSFQEIVRESVILKMRELIPVVSEAFRVAETEKETREALELFKYGERGRVIMLPKEEVESFPGLSLETKEVLFKNPEGIIDDLEAQIKLVSFFKLPGQRIAVSIVELPEFYALFLHSGNIFVLGLLSILLVTVIVSIFISTVVTRSIRTLSNSIHHLSSTKDIAVEVYTGDEIEDLSHTLSAYIKKERAVEQARKDVILATQHNLRTPLTIVKGYVNEIDSRTKEGRGADLERYVRETTNALDTMTDLVNGLIDVTELKVGKGGTVDRQEEKE